jgi:hypothetical protein
MRRKLRSKGNGSRAWKTRKLIWIAGKRAGPTPAFTEPPSGKTRRCSPKSVRHCFRCHSNLFRYYEYGERAVHLDGCVEVEAAYYGAPPGWIGRRVQVQWNDAVVRLLNPITGQLLREHPRQERGRHRIHDEDRPRRTPLSTQQLLHRAEKAGKHIRQLCQAMHAKHGELAVRRILGVLALAKKYGSASTDNACALALETSSREYHFVRRYLEHNPQLPLSLRQVDPLIRQLTLYRDLIESKTRQEDQS